MPMVLSEKKVKARKAHRCSCCNTVCIQPGDEYTKQANLADGRVYDWLMCTACAEVSRDVWEYAGRPYDEGIGPDSYSEWAMDLRSTDNRAAAYLERIVWTA